MGTLQDKELRGIGIGDRRTTFENLNPRDGSATASDYTEAGPRPGTALADDPRSRLIVEIQHAQGEELEVYVNSPGDPGPDSNAEILFRETDEAADPLEGWRAWNRPTFLHSSFTAAPDANVGSLDAAVIPSSQKVVLVYQFGNFLSRTFFGGWGSDKPFPTATGAAGSDCAVVVLPSERVLAISGTAGNVWYSDDDGDTWEVYSSGAFPVPIGSTRRSRAVVSGDQILFVTENALAPFTWKQWVSRDLGATFEQVDEVDVGEFLELLPFPDGSIGWFYKNNATGQATYRLTGSAFAPVSGAIGQLIDPGSPVADMTNAGVDPDGVIWAIVDEGVDQFVYTSRDFGDTWTKQTTAVFSAATIGPRPPNGKLLSVDGSLLWLNQWTAQGPVTETEVHAWFLGGWQNVGCGVDFGWGNGTGSFIAPQKTTWIPTDIPASGWVDIGAGTATILAGLKVLELVTVANNRNFQAAFTTIPTPMKFKDLIQVNHFSGGRLTLPDCGFDVRLADGVDDFAFQVNFSEEAGAFAQETRFRVLDLNSGATLIEVTPIPENLGAAEVQFLVDFDADVSVGPMSLDLFYRIVTNGNPATQWITAYSGLLTNAGAPAANGVFRWGHVQSGTATSRWTINAYKVSDSTVFDDFFALTLADKRGRSIGGVGYPFGFIEGALPPLRTLAPGVVLAALRGGPARLAETQTIPPSYDYSVQNLFAELSPSPRSLWRGTSPAALTTFAWDFPLESRIGDSWILGLLALRPNFISADIDVDTTGAGAYVNVGELNFALEFDGLTYIRNGDQVRPDTAATILADRYIHRNELAGGLFVTAGGTATRIIANTSGRWGPGTDHVQPILTLADNAAGPLSGLCALMPPRGVFLINLDGLVADYVHGVRIRIGALIAVVDEPYLEAGTLHPFAVTPFGQQPSRGWTQEMSPNTSETTSRSGTIRKRQEGPPARRWTWSWPDGVRMESIRQDAEPNYLGVPGKPPAITKEDVWTLLWGELEETKGGELAVVACNRIPQSVGVGVVLTDRTLFMLGTLDGSGRFDQVLGDEGVAEFGRVSPISLRELV